MGTATVDTDNRRWLLLLAVPAGLLGVGVAWLLARPEQPQTSSLLRVIADCAGATVLGLAALDRLQAGIGRPAVRAPVIWRTLAGLAGLWVLAEAALLLTDAAAAGSGTVGELGARSFVAFVGHISAGRVGVTALGCALLICGYATVCYRRAAGWPFEPVLGVTALALVIRPITGHMSQQPFGSVLGAVHALAAAAWFGGLVALALVVRTRSGWAALLPRYSGWALWLVLALVVTGSVNALVRLGGFAGLLDTGYGRIVLAKSFAALVLVLLAWWWRRTWVQPVAGHRMDVAGSLRRAIVEIGAMAVVFGLAAALATTG